MTVVVTVVAARGRSSPLLLLVLFLFLLLLLHVFRRCGRSSLFLQCGNQDFQKWIRRIRRGIMTTITKGVATIEASTQAWRVEFLFAPWPVSAGLNSPLKAPKCATPVPTHQLPMPRLSQLVHFVLRFVQLLVCVRGRFDVNHLREPGKD